MAEEPNQQFNFSTNNINISGWNWPKPLAQLDKIELATEAPNRWRLDCETLMNLNSSFIIAMTDLKQAVKSKAKNGIEDGVNEKKNEFERQKKAVQLFMSILKEKLDKSRELESAACTTQKRAANSE